MSSTFRVRSLEGDEALVASSSEATVRTLRKAYEVVQRGVRARLYWRVRGGGRETRKRKKKQQARPLACSLRAFSNLINLISSSNPQGAALDDRALASTLALGPDDFIVAINTRRRRHRRWASSAEEAAGERTPPPPPPPALLPSSTPPSPTPVTTLLPGYAFRPHASPQARAGRALTSVLEDAGGEQEAGFVRRGGGRAATRARRGPTVGVVEAPAPAPEPAPAAAAPPPRRPAAASAPSGHPLPPALDALEPVFASLAAAYDFLTRQHILPSWRLVVSSSSSSSTGAAAVALHPATVRAAAVLCPGELRLRPPAWREAAARYAAGGAAAADAEEASGQPPDPARPWAASPPPASPAACPPTAPTPPDDVVDAGPIPGDWVLDMARPRTRSGGPTRANRGGAFRGALAAAASALEAELSGGGGGGSARPGGPWALAADAPLAAFVAAARRARIGGSREPATTTRPRPASGAAARPTPASILACLKAAPWYADQATAEVGLPPRPARHAAPAVPLAPPAAAAARAAGVDPARLWAHQAAALDAAASNDGRPVLVVTPTASGKSLCFTLPLAAALAADPAATALLLFPTKALAQDQCRSVSRALAAAGVASGCGGPVAAVFDGDVPPQDRAALLKHARCLLTNPDMLHRTILPGLRAGGGGGGDTTTLPPPPVPPGGGWPAFLAHLALVAVDEVHAYTGAFGSHASLVLRRLWRAVDLCSLPPGRPLPLCVAASATVGNAGEHAEALLGRGPVTVVDEDGSPAGARTFVVWRPPPAGRAGGGGGGGAPTAAAPPPPPPATKRARAEAVRARAAAAERGEVGEGSEACVLSEAERLAAARLGRKRAGGGVGGVASRAPPALRSTPSPPPPPGAPALLPPARPPSPSRYLGGQAGVAPPDPALTAAAQAAPPCPPPPLPSPSLRTKPRPPPLRLAWDTAGLLGRGAPPPPRAAAAVPAPGLPLAAPPPLAPTASHHHRTASPIVEAGLLLAACARAGARTLAFCRTRKLAELVASHARAALDGEADASGRGLADRVAAYRGGFEPAHRRAVEAGLFGGALLGVACTNALELGVDIGDLDVTLHLGVPGAAAALWQQAGRAGRRACEGTESGGGGGGGGGALHIIIPFDGPLDAWWAARPATLLARPVEAARCDPTTPCLLAAHVACAAAEAPPLSVAVDERWFGGGGTTSTVRTPLAHAVQTLRAAGVLAPMPGVGGDGGSAVPLFYAGAEPCPAATFSLRAIDPDTFSVILEVDKARRRDGAGSAAVGGVLLEKVEASKAFFALYDGAVWIHQGRTHLVKHVDVAARTATVRRASVAYHTKTQDTTAVSVGAGVRAAGGGTGAAATLSGPATVTTRFFGFHRISKASHRIFDTVDLLGLPDVVLETAAAWLPVPPAARAAILGRLGGGPAALLLLPAALHAACHALVRACPAAILCNPDDLGTECSTLCGRVGGSGGATRLLAFDRAPGGAGGLAPRLAAALASGLLADAAALVSSCTCEEVAGCPGCVQVAGCGEYNACLHKLGAVIVLEEVGR